jgi:hypothetical protein
MCVLQVQLTQFALKKLDVVVDEFWAEISDSIQTIEVVYEDKMYPPEVCLLPSVQISLKKSGRSKESQSRLSDF